MVICPRIDRPGRALLFYPFRNGWNGNNDPREELVLERVRRLAYSFNKSRTTFMSSHTSFFAPGFRSR